MGRYVRRLMGTHVGRCNATVLQVGKHVDRYIGGKFSVIGTLAILKQEDEYVDE